MAAKIIAGYLYQRAEEHPEKIALIADGVSTSYGRLAALASGYASFLKEKGLVKGDVVVIKSSQTLDYVAAYLAIQIAGGIAAPLEKNIPAANAAAIARQLCAKMIISNEPTALPREDAVFLDSTRILADAESAPPATHLLPEEEDSAVIMFTTGTTGISKGVEVSHRALVANAEKFISGCSYQKDTVIIVPSPMNHAAGVWKLAESILNGSTVYLLSGMADLKGFYNALDSIDGRIGTVLPPAAIRTLFGLTGDRIGAYDGKIDFIEIGSAPLPEPDKQRLSRLLPNARLYICYGASESGFLSLYNYNDHPGKVGCVGKTLPGSQVIVVNDDREVIQSSREHMGRLACKGNSTMKGYFNEPELTRQVLVDGVVYTNDIGYIDEEGFVFIVGRADDVINVSGLKIAPTEVEEAALSIDGIEDCICVPMPHPISGQASKLLVVMREGAEFSPKAISAALQDKLEGYKIPLKFEQVDSVARTYNGKLDRKAYRQ